MHHIEPELLIPIPRKIEPIDKGFWKAFGCLGLFFTPFILIGVGSFCYVFILTLVLCFGSVVPGEVIGKREVRRSKGGDSHILQYRFRHGEGWATGENSVNYGAYTSATEGKAIRVRYLPPLQGRLSAVEGDTEAWGTVRFMWVWVLGWNFGLRLFFKLTVGKFGGIRHLLRVGTPTTATITEKNTTTGSQSPTYSVAYTFHPIQDSPSTEEVKGTIDNLSEEEWKQVEMGQTYTVLYLPKQPQTNTLYAFSLMKVARH